MATGTELMTLKRKATSTLMAAEYDTIKGSGWFASSWLAGTAIVVATMCVGVAFAISNIASQPQERNLSEVALSIGCFAVSAFIIVFLKRLTVKQEMKLAGVRKTVDDAIEDYLNALMAELASYGIDTSGRNDRTRFMGDDYEFTALRNGTPIDVTVRHFNNEVVIMMNGERLQKGTSV